MGAQVWETEEWADRGGSRRGARPDKSMGGADVTGRGTPVFIGATTLGKSCKNEKHKLLGKEPKEVYENAKDCFVSVTQMANNNTTQKAL